MTASRTRATGNMHTVLNLDPLLTSDARFWDAEPAWESPFLRGAQCISTKRLHRVMQPAKATRNEGDRRCKHSNGNRQSLEAARVRQRGFQTSSLIYSLR